MSPSALLGCLGEFLRLFSRDLRAGTDQDVEGSPPAFTMASFCNPLKASRKYGDLGTGSQQGFPIGGWRLSPRKAAPRAFKGDREPCNSPKHQSWWPGLLVRHPVSGIGLVSSHVWILKAVHEDLVIFDI